MGAETTMDMLRVEWWPDTTNGEGQLAALDVERDEGDRTRVAIHTSKDGRGSLNSYYLDRDNARYLALRLLMATELP